MTWFLTEKIQTALLKLTTYNMDELQKLSLFVHNRQLYYSIVVLKVIKLETITYSKSG